MHVLLTNDDGPLDDLACPYMKYFVDEINRSTDWKVSIVVPNQQRSWIGKAHFAGRSLSTSYIYTKESTHVCNADINKFEGPFESPSIELISKGYQEWCLVDSTPAACTDIGIHHLKQHQEPIDLVVSGPNFGKNSGNLYILASGTVGAAMEAVTHGIKSIALSYEFRDINHNFEILKEASKISVNLVEHLYGELKKQSEVDLFSINVPLIPSLESGKTKIKYAPILKNTWGSIYTNLGDGKFGWAPDFKQVWKDGLEDVTHSDSRVLLDEGISVTPLKASFTVVEPLEGEIVLNQSVKELSMKKEHNNVFLITIPELAYIYEPYVTVFKKLGFRIEKSLLVLEELKANLSLKVFHYCEYEDIDLDLVQSHPQQYFVPSYIYRKALIRKHFLANTIRHYTVKNPESILHKAFPECYQLEVDYAEFLDDALDDAYELREEIELGEKTWILKPSMSDKGQGIRIFQTIPQLQAIFDSFEQDESDIEDEDEEDNNGVIISQLRHFVVQEYQSHPLLLLEYLNRKFHLRTYVVCKGNLKVFVYENILALFASVPYIEPGNSEEDEIIELAGHLTNTCLQDGYQPVVVPFWALRGVEEPKKAAIFDQVKAITGELFKAASSVDRINFQPMDNAIEIFGIDFLVDADYEVKLLEVNSYPDFKQTGDDLKTIIDGLFNSVATELVSEMFDLPAPESAASLLHEVL
ncbi:CIC11C00000005308 [Sungouiella intermedia]|uniref:CIC11C00000005308 n=1 Tax=Sungouiella intermedia TaxID=45354 RepID=A0A1L0DD08_9ASCO|nr:CIC11C00000005308 [[Candida] intermedia]